MAPDEQLHDERIRLKNERLRLDRRRRVNRIGWTALGIVIGLFVAAGLGVIVIQIVIPWEAICATVAPTQELVRVSNALISELQSWLAQAEEFLSAGGSTPDRQGLGGLIGRAQEVAQPATSAVIDIVTAPLRTLIDAAQAVLASVQSVLDAANSSLASIDQAQCN